MEAITKYFQGKDVQEIVVDCVITDQEDAYVQTRAEKLCVPSFYLTRKELSDPNFLIPFLEKRGIYAIILAGYLRLIPQFLLDAYPRKIVNIHPALLPKYGGKGMYGMNVHQAVKEANEKETGITIHIIDHEYDKGEILCQEKVCIDPCDPPEDIAQKVHTLEHQYFASTIEKWINSKN